MAFTETDLLVLQAIGELVTIPEVHTPIDGLTDNLLAFADMVLAVMTNEKVDSIEFGQKYHKLFRNSGPRGYLMKPIEWFDEQRGDALIKLFQIIKEQG